MEKQNKAKSTATVPPISNQEGKTFPNQDSQNASKDTIKNSSGGVLKTKHTNEQPVSPRITETHFFKECVRKGTFEDYSKRYPNGRYTKEAFNLMKSNNESLKAERTFGYIGAIIGLPFLIIFLIWGLIYDSFKYCDRKCVAMARSMDKYFNFQN